MKLSVGTIIQVLHSVVLLMIRSEKPHKKAIGTWWHFQSTRHPRDLTHATFQDVKSSTTRNLLGGTLTEEVQVVLSHEDCFGSKYQLL